MAKSRDLPPRVYKRSSGSYEYHPPTGGSVTIAKKGASKQEVWEAYRKVMQFPGTVSHLYEKYTESQRYQRLKVSTKKDYDLAWKKIKPVFSHVQGSTIRPAHVRKYMDMRTSNKRANTERILLKNILSWGIQYGYLDSNPCDLVDPFRMEPRTKYVTDAEYSTMYDRVPDIIKVFMELSYICAARGQDVRELKLVGNIENQVSGILEKGLFIRQGKTGKMQIKLWNERLRAVVDMALALRKVRLEKCGHSSTFLIVTRTGGPYTSDGLKAMWQKCRYEGMDWTFHDLKAKGISDFEGDKQNFSGHRQRLQMEKYNRSPDETEVIDFPRDAN